MLFWLPVLLHSAVADTGGDCSVFGEVSPETASVYLGEYVTFFVSGGRSCGDVDACEWRVDDNQGELAQTTGSPVTWHAPIELEDCLPVTFRIYTDCPDASGTGSAEITVRCTDAQIDELSGIRDATVGGGSGCLDGGVAAAVVLPALGLLGIRRRKS